MAAAFHWNQRGEVGRQLLFLARVIHDPLDNLDASLYAVSADLIVFVRRTHRGLFKAIDNGTVDETQEKRCESILWVLWCRTSSRMLPDLANSSVGV